MKESVYDTYTHTHITCKTAAFSVFDFSLYFFVVEGLLISLSTLLVPSDSKVTQIQFFRLKLLISSTNSIITCLTASVLNFSFRQSNRFLSTSAELSTMETLRGPQFTMNDGNTLVTEVVSDDDSHLCLYILLQDMLKIGDLVVGFDIEWGFKGSSTCRSGSSSGRNSEYHSGRNSEYHSQSDKSELLIPRRVEHHIAVLTLCTRLGCVLIRLAPNHISPSLKRFLSIKDIMFVGVHIKEDLQRLRSFDGLVVRNAVDLSELAAKIYDQPRFLAYNGRELAYKISSLKLDPKPLNVLWSNWFDHTLSTEQIESATIDAYATYKIGKKLMESGSSSVKRMFS